MPFSSPFLSVKTVSETVPASAKLAKIKGGVKPVRASRKLFLFIGLSDQT
jgi:hypothetical protein